NSLLEFAGEFQTELYQIDDSLTHTPKGVNTYDMALGARIVARLFVEQIQVAMARLRAAMASSDGAFRQDQIHKAADELWQVWRETRGTAGVFRNLATNEQFCIAV